MSRALPSPLCSEASAEASAAAFDYRGLRRRLRARGCVALRLRPPGPAHFRSHLTHARTLGNCDYARRKRSCV